VPGRKSGDRSHAGKWKREEWDVSLVGDGGAAVYRIFKDCATERWFVEEIYD
jgi:inorganic triphosphatase YgiF